MTEANVLPSASLNPKSALAKVRLASSFIVIVASVPLGASATAVTLNVNVLGVKSVFVAALLSTTANCKVAYPVPLALATGVNTSLFASRSATVID